MAQFYDTLLWEYIKDPGVRWLSLDKIALREWKYKMQSYEEVTMKKKLNFREVELVAASIYSGEDVYITHKLFQKQNKEKTSQDKILQEIEIPLIEVLKNMELDGVKIDRDRLKSIGALLENEIQKLEKEILNEAWVEFNISSPKQVGEVLFDTLWLPKGKKTKTGYSVSAEVLSELAFKFPIAQKIVDYRHYSKILSTYINGLIELLDQDDFLHTSYNQFIAATGRLSSTTPNLQNIPMNDGIAWEVRNAFISRFENGKIIAFDYSQIEIRLLALMSKDKNLVKAFQEETDIHANTAELIGTKERKIAKAVNFWVIYGISGFGLSKMINIPMKDANEYINKFFLSYPEVKKYLESIIKICEKTWYVETLFGRKRYIKWINDANKIIKKAAEREAINMPIQWTNADIIKISMIQIYDFLQTPLQTSPLTGERLKNWYLLKSKLIMQVHDELVFDVFPWEENIIKETIPNIMENIVKNENIQLKVDTGIGTNWKEAK